MSNPFKKLILCCLVLWTVAAVTMGQHSPYSLQAAVDALHRRELQLALKDNYNNPRTRYAPATIDEDDYWDGIETEGPSDRRRLNKLLARYLQNEEDNEAVGGGESYENDFDDENFIPIEERKRSFFRENERNEPQYMGTVFREREFPRNNQQELTEKFLREIEEERDLEREERYKEALKNLWEKYQQQENEIEDELFEDEKRKRFLAQESDTVGSQYVGPLMQKKRSYPVLPWLPYNKKKRFPVSKRSPKMPMKPFSTSNEANGNDQISKDLQAIFGPTGEEKKKRSISSPPSSSSSQSTPSVLTATTISTEKSNENNHIQEKRNAKPISSNNEHNSHGHHGEHHQSGSSGDHRHHNDDSSESRESEEEHIDESHEEEHEDHSHEHASEEEDDDNKKKRSVADKKNVKKSDEIPAATAKKKRANLEVVKEDQIIPGDLESPKKKSIDWSNYFGLDRRKKSIFPLKKSKKMVPLKKRSPIDLLADEKRKKRNFSEEKLDQMDSKLKSIEDLIIDETIKYTGAHEGIRDPEKIRELKDHVLSRLATAYNLEKMRRALEKLRESVENENHLARNEIEGFEDNTKEKEKAAAAKRLSVKKEKVEFENEHRQPEISEKQTETTDNGLKDDEDEERKRKKKRNGGGSIRFSDAPNELSDFEEELGAGHFEPHNDVYLGRQNNGPLSINQCPIIDSMSERCRNVDILSGDIHQDLLPICGVHELCYLCGISPVACDLQYLSDADTICGHNSDCQSAARSVLMILRGTPGPQLGPKECLKNPCLYRVMREIGL